MRKRSTGSHGARGCTKGHETAFDDSEHKISEVALRDLTEDDRNHTSLQRLLSAEMPIVHLTWNWETSQVAELTRRKIMPLAATPNLCNIFAGRISRFLSN